MNVIEAIERRRSVRTYDGKALSSADEKFLCDMLPSVIDGGGRIVLLRDIEQGRVGTYGVFRNVPAWFVVISPDDDRAVLNAAMCMEDIVTACTMRSLATCWVGGTFRQSTVVRRISLSSGESVKAIVAVGYASERESLLSRVSSKVIGSRRRKPFGDLFRATTGSFGPFERALEGVRLAPSAVNAQPWRAVVSGGEVVFSCVTRNDYSMLDMGIALSHFKTVCRYEGIEGNLAIDIENAEVEGARQIAFFRLNEL